MKCLLCAKHRRIRLLRYEVNCCVREILWLTVHSQIQKVYVEQCIAKRFHDSYIFLLFLSYFLTFGLIVFFCLRAICYVKKNSFNTCCGLTTAYCSTLFIYIITVKLCTEKAYAIKLYGTRTRK